MNKGSIVCLALLPLLIVTLHAEEQEPFPTEDSFYSRSLHNTNRGIEYLYSKEQGGLERLTGISATELGCAKASCHAKSCDNCHRKDQDGKAVYSTAQARTEEACHKCHGDPEPDNPDVHAQGKMKCMDCHTAREIHGDGILHNTYMEPGFFDVSCEKCHQQISQISAHTVHNGKLDCAACHVLKFQACHNCHIDSRLRDKKSSSVELKNIYFLVNHDGKVQLANYLSFVYGNRTMITLAPFFPHSIQKKGRDCAACHNTPIARQIQKENFAPMKWEGDQLTNVEGFVPVVEGMDWKLVFLTKEGDKWIPLKDPEAPIVHFSGSCTPLSKDQFQKLLAPPSGQ
jgi:hypothetical protein